VSYLYKLTFFTIIIIFSQIISAYCLEKEIKLSGNTMGTTYHITAYTPLDLDPTILKKKVAIQLKMINKSMSTFLIKSEISKFNRLTNTKTMFHASADFYSVMLTAKNIYNVTDGAWDGTVNPLVALWGFKKNTAQLSIPSLDKINNTLSYIGFNNIQFKGQRVLSKKKPFVTVDLASIAKGYGVDKITELLLQNKIKNCMVEIGGEVACRGTKQNKKPWKVGINFPSINAGINKIYKVVRLSNMAMATSGNYRNFFKLNGKLYSHIINPKTGFPVDNNIVSVSVTAKSCAMADGLATAIIILGYKKGIKVINNIENTECLIIIQDKEGVLNNYVSNGF